MIEELEGLIGMRSSAAAWVAHQTHSRISAALKEFHEHALDMDVVVGPCL
jgi:hypothetical protein